MNLQEALVNAGLVRDQNGRAVKPGLNRPQPKAPPRPPKPPKAVRRRIGKVDLACTREDKFCYLERLDAIQECERLEKTYGLASNSLYVYHCVRHKCDHIGGAVLEGPGAKSAKIRR